MRKFYFCGSIRGGRELVARYKKIIGILGQHGRVLTEHLGSDTEIRSRDRLLSDREIHDRDLKWIMESDMVVAEVTVPSLGVGYEISRAVHLGKPVLCLHQSGSQRPLSAMIAGCPDLDLHRYNLEKELDDILREYLSRY